MEDSVLVAVAKVEAGEPAARFMNENERHAGN